MGDELLIYDLDSHRAHCLNSSARELFVRLDGKRSVRELVRDLGDWADVTEDWVWAGLRELARAELLEGTVRQPSRRSLIKAAVALPAVTTILAPTAARAANTCKKEHQSCQTSSECCAPLLCNPVTGKCE
jgi:hypothetical protein